MTREELQRLYDRYKQTGRYSHLLALADGVHRFLEQDDPTVEIACLKATLADVKAEREAAQENARTAWAVHSEHTERTGVIIAAHVSDAVFATTRAEKAEAAIERLTVGLDRCREQYGYAVDRAQQHQARAEAAEQAIQRVRDMPATPPSGGYYMVSMRDVLRALDGGAS